MEIKKLILKYLLAEDYTIYSEHKEIIQNIIRINSDKQELSVKELEKTKKLLPLYFNEVIEIQKDGREILGLEKNKEEYIIVTKCHFGDNLWILLYSPSYGNCKPRIMATIRKNNAFGWNYIQIEDILMEKNNIGNGSIAMKYFIEAAKEFQVDKITGWLSDTDKGHWERSIHYYEKFGFIVNINKENTSGSITYNFDSIK